ncbi:hypothetical protein ACFL2H_08250 [Planctomycetota bacterium]
MPTKDSVDRNNLTAKISLKSGQVNYGFERFEVDGGVAESMTLGQFVSCQFLPRYRHVQNAAPANAPIE